MVEPYILSMAMKQLSEDIAKEKRKNTVISHLKIKKYLKQQKYFSNIILKNETILEK